MYENILHQPLQIPGGRTVAACDLLQGLLHKDQRQRLGSKEDFVGDQAKELGSPPAETAQGTWGGSVFCCSVNLGAASAFA